MHRSPSRKTVAAWVAAVLGAVLAVGAWAVASPSGSSPDDNFHVATIWCKSPWHAGRCEYEGPAPGGAWSYYEVPAHIVFGGPDVNVNAPCYALRSTESGDCPPATDPKRLTINDGLYPPLFYAYAGLFAAESTDRTVLQVRFAVGLSAVILLAGTYAATLRWLRPAYITSLAVGLVPIGLAFVASTNPSGWTIPAVLASWPLAVSTLLAETRRRRLILGGLWLVSAVMAGGSRADGAAYVALISLLATAVLWRRTGWGPRILALLIVAGSGLSVGRSGQTSNVTAGFLEELPERSVEHVVWQAIKGVPALWFGATGAPGGPDNNMSSQLSWFDAPVPPGAWIGLLMVMGALLILGIAWLPRPKAVSLVVLLTALVCVTVYPLITNRALPGELIQPRYLLPLVLTTLGVALLRDRDNRLVMTRVQVAAMAVVVAVAQSLALHTFMRRFITGIDTDGIDLGADLQWWWQSSPSPNAVWIAGSIGWGLVVTVALMHFLPLPPPGREARADEVAVSSDSTGRAA